MKIRRFDCRTKNVPLEAFLDQYRLALSVLRTDTGFYASIDECGIKVSGAVGSAEGPTKATEEEAVTALCAEVSGRVLGKWVCGKFTELCIAPLLEFDGKLE